MINNVDKFPQITAIVAMSLDGKISDKFDRPAKFSSKEDLQHLEEQISLCDAIIFGANTLRAYGTSLVIKKDKLLKQRQEKNQTNQPLNIVCSETGNLDSQIRFFSQPLPRGLITTSQGLINITENFNRYNLDINDYFEQIFTFNTPFIWQDIINNLSQLSYKKIGILGGSKLISSLLKEHLINDLWITICPLIIGTKQATNFLNNDIIESSIELNLLEIKHIDQEIFLHYKLK